MKKPILFLGLLAFGFSTLVHGQTAGREPVPPSFQITAGDYSHFLNTSAKNHSNDFYDEKMAADFTGASIIRTGGLGDYLYEVIKEGGNVSVRFLSWNDATAFCEWKNKENGSTSDVICCEVTADKELKSNLLSFRIVKVDAIAHQVSGTELACEDLLDEWIPEFIGVIFLGLDMGAGKSAAEGSEADHASRRNPEQFMLQKLREAAARSDNAGVNRLIMSGEGVNAVITARVADPNTVGRNRSEDMFTKEILKSALKSDGHSEKFVKGLIDELLPHANMLDRLRHVREPLSYEKLTTILARADAAKVQRVATVQPAPAGLDMTTKQATNNRTTIRKIIHAGVEGFFRSVGIHNKELAERAGQIFVPQTAEEIAAELQRAIREQAEVESMIRDAIHRGRQPAILNTHYKPSHDALMAAEAAHYRGMVARWEAKEKKEVLDRAQEFFKEVKAALDERRELAEFDPTMWSKISQGATVVSVFLGMFNLPFVSLQGVADAVSQFATVADQRLTTVQARAAYGSLKIALQEATEALEKNKKSEEAAPNLHSRAQQMECDAIKIDSEATLSLATAIKSPIELVDEVTWHNWAKEIACELYPEDLEKATTAVHLLYGRGRKNIKRIQEIVSSAWEERRTFSIQESERLENEHSPEAEKVKALDTAYEAAVEKEKCATAEAAAAVVRFEATAEAQANWQAIYEKLREEKNNLEDQLQTDPSNRKTLQRQLDAQRSALSIHQAQKMLLEASYETAANDAKKLAAVATAVHKEAFEKFKEYDVGKKQHERNIARTKARAEADHEAWINVWPELHFKKLAEEAFAKAQQEHNVAEVAWPGVWNEAMTLCAQAGPNWAEQADEVATAFQEAADLAGSMEIVWTRAHEAQQIALAKIPEKYQELRTALVANRDKAKVPRSAWIKKRIQSEKNSLDAKDSKTAEAKAAFEKVKPLLVSFLEATEAFRENSEASILEAAAIANNISRTAVADIAGHATCITKLYAYVHSALTTRICTIHKKNTVFRADGFFFPAIERTIGVSCHMTDGSSNAHFEYDLAKLNHTRYMHEKGFNTGTILTIDPTGIIRYANTTNTIWDADYYLDDAFATKEALSFIEVVDVWKKAKANRAYDDACRETFPPVVARHWFFRFFDKKK